MKKQYRLAATEEVNIGNTVYVALDCYGMSDWYDSEEEAWEQYGRPNREYALLTRIVKEDGSTNQDRE